MPDPAPGPRDVVVTRRPAAASAAPTCTSWTASSRRRFPIVPGHEFAGEVVAVGADGHRGARSATRWRSTRRCTAASATTAGAARGNLCEQLGRDRGHHDRRRRRVRGRAGGELLRAARRRAAPPTRRSSSRCPARYAASTCSPRRAGRPLPHLRRRHDGPDDDGAGQAGRRGHGVSMVDLNPDRLETARRARLLRGRDRSRRRARPPARLGRGHRLHRRRRPPSRTACPGSARAARSCSSAWPTTTRGRTIEPYKIYNQEITHHRLDGGAAQLRAGRRAVRRRACSGPEVFISDRFPLDEYAEGTGPVPRRLGRKSRSSRSTASTPLPWLSGGGSVRRWADRRALRRRAGRTGPFRRPRGRATVSAAWPPVSSAGHRARRCVFGSATRRPRRWWSAPPRTGWSAPRAHSAPRSERVTPRAFPPRQPSWGRTVAGPRRVGVKPPPGWAARRCLPARTTRPAGTLPGGWLSPRLASVSKVMTVAMISNAPPVPRRRCTAARAAPVGFGDHRPSGTVRGQDRRPRTQGWCSLRERDRRPRWRRRGRRSARSGRDRTRQGRLSDDAASRVGQAAASGKRWAGSFASAADQLAHGRVRRPAVAAARQSLP